MEKYIEVTGTVLGASWPSLNPATCFMNHIEQVTESFV